MPVVNAQPHPRVLLEDLPDDLAAAVAPLFSTTRRITRSEQVHEAEWDALITTAPVTRSGDLHVVVFGAYDGGSAIAEDVAGNSRSASIHRERRTLATELEVPPGLPPALAALVRSDLVPLFADREEKQGLRGYGQVARPTPVSLRDFVDPFLLAGDGTVLAGRYRRPRPFGRPSTKATASCWFIPETTNPAGWVAAALGDWSALDPERFPGAGDWTRRTRWLTVDEHQADDELSSTAQERARLLAELDRREAEARERRESAAVAAATGPRRLLTARGEGLAQAVAAALADLGFTVRDMDTVHPAGDRREDLRVQDPDATGWEAIVEIKGYTKGGAVNDLARVNWWAGRYRDETGRWPDARWHIVNAFTNADPDTRPPLLDHPGDLAVFAEDDGLVLDTRDLFRAGQAVARGDLEPVEVRRALREQRGRWTPPLGGADE